MTGSSSQLQEAATDLQESAKTVVGFINKCIDDVIHLSTVLHLTMTHLERRNTYARISLIADFSSAFNTILSQQRVDKQQHLNTEAGICRWILDFFTHRQQPVRIGSRTSSTITVTTRSPQGCVPSTLLFTLLTPDCSARHNSNYILKFANNTTVVGLISSEDKSTYREEVEQLVTWCTTHSLKFNLENVWVEMIMDFRRARAAHHVPLIISGASVVRAQGSWDFI